MKSRRKIAIVVAILIILSNTMEVLAKSETPQTKAYAKVSSDLNLRAEPSVTSNVLEKLKPGTLLVVQGNAEGGDWTKVKLLDGTEGYVSSNYIVIPNIDIEKYELISAAVITSNSSGSNRNFNMAKASAAINGITLQPGDEFNWYGDEDTAAVVGPAEKAYGYKAATILSGGKYVLGYGGGVCQVSTAVYNCIVKLGIEPTEHHHHSIPSSYVEEGMDATVSYSSNRDYMKNFVFKNTLEYPIMLEAYTDGGQVIMLAYKVTE